MKLFSGIRPGLGFVLALVGVAVGGHAAEAEPAIDVLRVTAGALNARSGPGTSYSPVAVILKGQTYSALERNGPWVRLQIGARAAWSHKDYLTHDYWALGSRYITQSQLNVRTGPSTRYRVVGMVPYRTPVAVQRLRGDWAQISYEGRTAYVWAGRLSRTYPGTAPTPASAPPASTPTASTPTASAPTASAPPSTPSRPRSRVGYIQLAAAGRGFESYAAAHKRWGRPELVYGIERAAARWATERRDRIGVGDLSLKNGGPIYPHASHQRGIDVDIALVRADGKELPVTIFSSQYSRTWTRRAIELLRAEIPTNVVYFNDSGVPGVVWSSGHDNHLHLRMSN
jgi:uncharacterized protein YraI